MFKITQFEFKSPAFEQALYKLCSVHFSDDKVSYNLAKILRRYKTLSKDCQKKWEELYMPYVLRDEHGVIIPLDGKPGTFQADPAKKAEWDAAVQAFNETVVEFDCHQITLDQVREAKLTPYDLVELEPLLIPNSPE